MDASVTIHQRSGYRFRNEFGAGMPSIESDLSPPLGEGAGPSPEHFLCAAVANCLSSSLVFALARFKEDPGPLTTTALARVGRNEHNRMRVLGIEVKMTLGGSAADLPHLARALETFEDYCTVTASVRAAIPVTLQVLDATGTRLK